MDEAVRKSLEELRVSFGHRPDFGMRTSVGRWHLMYVHLADSGERHGPFNLTHAKFNSTSVLEPPLASRMAFIQFVMKFLNIKVGSCEFKIRRQNVQG